MWPSVIWKRQRKIIKWTIAACIFSSANASSYSNCDTSGIASVECCYVSGRLILKLIEMAGYASRGAKQRRALQTTGKTITKAAHSLTSAMSSAVHTTMSAIARHVWCHLCEDAERDDSNSKIDLSEQPTPQTNYTQYTRCNLLAKMYNGRSIVFVSSTFHGNSIAPQKKKRIRKEK